MIWCLDWITSCDFCWSKCFVCVCVGCFKKKKKQAIQDMNTLKRFIRQAEMSHYALFRCCLFLQSCGNRDVLLQNARAEHSGLSEACSIIRVLEEFLSEQAAVTAQWCVPSGSGIALCADVDGAVRQRGLQGAEHKWNVIRVHSYVPCHA